MRIRLHSLTANERALAHILASVAAVDVRTAARALREGPEVIRYAEPRERIARAIQELDALQGEAGAR